MIPQENEVSQSQSPLCIVLEKMDLTRDGHFRPSAFIKLTKTFRTSGLLHTLPPEELKSFFTVLSFLTSNGDCSPTLSQLASAMRLSQTKTRARMQRLCQFFFENEPLVVVSTRGDGQEAYALKSHLIPTVEKSVETPKPEPLQAVPRQRLIEYSRNRYAKTREEVEKQIAELNGWDVPPLVAEQTDDTTAKPASQNEATPPQQKELRRHLQNLGIAPDQIEYLFSNFDLERIKQQLGWLPFRQARNPSAYLVAAIVHDYEEPIYRR